MSIENLNRVIRRAVAEPLFQSLLLRDAGQALCEYDLSAAELAMLTGLTQMKMNLVQVAPVDAPPAEPAKLKTAEPAKLKPVAPAKLKRAKPANIAQAKPASLEEHP